MFCLLDWSGYRDGLGAAITADFTDPYSIGSSRRSRLPFDLVTFSTPRACVHHWSAATDANDGIRLSYGLGWGLYWSPYGKIVFREGHDDGFRNYSVVFDKSRNGMVIMTNSSNGEGIFRELLETLLRDMYTPIEWEGFTPWTQLSPRPPLSATRKSRSTPRS